MFTRMLQSAQNQYVGLLRVGAPKDDSKWVTKANKDKISLNWLIDKRIKRRETSFTVQYIQQAKEVKKFIRNAKRLE